MMDGRQNFRLRRQIEIAWSVPEQKVEGQGKVFNVSISGMLFETDKLFDPQHGMAMLFCAPQIPAFPSQGKLVWFRKGGEGQSHYQCGIKFPTTTSVIPAWVKWMEENILKLAEAEDNTILTRYLGF